MTTITGDDNIYSASYLTELAGATLSGNTSTQFTLSVDGYTLTVSGTGFTYSGNGPSGGTITSINVHEPSATATTFSSLSVSAATLWSYVRSADINDFNNLLFSGNNTFTANDSGMGSVFEAFGNGTDVFNMQNSQGPDGLVGGNGVNTFNYGNNFNNGTAILGGSGYNALNFTAGANNVNLTHVANIETINLTAGYDYTIALGLNTSSTIDGTSLGANDTMNITQFTTSSTALSIEGGDGNDTVVIGGGNVTFNGDGGTNTVSFAQLSSGVTFNLGLATQTIDGASDTFVNVENVIGTNYNDTITGGSQNSTIVATPGNDTYDAGSGFDIVDYSQLPNATETPVHGMTFNLNTDSVTKPNGNGTDTLNGINGIIGTGNGDTFVGNSDNNYFAENSLSYDENTVDYSGATGPMTFTETSETSSARTIIASGGGEGTDTLKNIGKIIGSPDGNVFILDDPSSTYVQGSGSDTIILTESSNFSLGTWGNTTASAQGVTTLVAPGGNYNLHSSTGNDTIFAGGGGGTVYLATTGNHFVDAGVTGNGVSYVSINDQKSNYTITQNGDRTTLTGPGGVDTLVGVGIIEFDDDEVYSLFGASGPAKALAPYDFDGNGTSDILLQNTNGQAVIWTQFGFTSIAQTQIGSNPGPTWRVVGSGDFNNDGYADILWQDSDGSVAIWEMNGSNLMGGGIAGNPGPSWKVIGSGDFNGDGYSDILWQNADGTVAVWEMNGTNVIGGGIVGTGGPTWHAVATGDFNGDGKSDIVLQNNDGSVAIWEMNGSTLIGGGVLSNPGSTWHVIGTGDFNGDGKSDILWQNDDGTVAIWEMNGTTVIGGGIVGSPGTSWHVIGTGDYNGDGFSDILWQNTDGTVAIWEMDGTTTLGGAIIGTTTSQIKAGTSPTSQPSGGAGSSPAAMLAANTTTRASNLTTQSDQLSVPLPWAGDPHFAHILPIGRGGMFHSAS